MQLRHLFLLIAGFLSLQAKTQTYTPLVVENAHWVNYEESSNGPILYQNLFGYAIQGDTSVNGNTYKKVYRYQFLPPQDPNPPSAPYEWTIRSLFALIREADKQVFAVILNTDTLQVQEFCPDPAPGVENLWYDFNLQVGDTISACLDALDQVLTIGQIAQENVWGAMRTNYELDQGGKLIEGIGANTGLFDWRFALIFIPEYSYTLESFCIGTDEDCQFVKGPSSARDRIATSLYRVFPSPAIDQIQVQAPGYPLTCQVFDMLGKAVSPPARLQGPGDTIPVGHLLPGVYSLAALTETGRTTTLFVKGQ